MTQELTIATPFADFAELSESFAQRVDQERFMLPYAEAVAEGEWAQFTVLLGDGSVAIAGIGRVQGCFDNGEEHPPEYRFDVVLESLQFEGMNEVMFERLLVARETASGGAQGTGEVSIAELEQQHAEEQQAEETGEAVAPPPAPEPRPAAAAPAAPPPSKKRKKEAAPAKPEPGKLPSPHTINGDVLTRDSLPPGWSPQVEGRPEPAQSSGLFDYKGGVPKPAKPPRPERADRVQAAPRPGAPWPRQRAETSSEVAHSGGPTGGEGW